MPCKCSVKYKQETEMGTLMDKRKEKLKSLSHFPLLGMTSKSSWIVVAICFGSKTPKEIVPGHHSISMAYLTIVTHKP